MSSLHVASRRAFPVLLAVLGTLTACSRTAAPPQGFGAVPVTVVTLAPQSVTLTRELPGRTTPYLVAEVRPQVSGIIARRLFTEGGLVKAGQPLYQIEDATYRADDASARAGLARAEAAFVTAQLNARRSAELVKIDAVSKQDDENAAATLRQAEADVKSARAAADRAGVVLGFARITSPIGGRIGKSAVTQGALVTANQAAALATVQQLDPIYVDVTQSSAELLELRRALAAGTLTGTRDLPVTILLEDGTRYEHDGKLAFSDVTVDPTTGSFALRVVVPNPDYLLLPGMYVRAVIGDGERQHALLVPQQGVAHDQKGQTTSMVVGKDGKVEVRAVRVSRTIGDRWLVEEGLAAGDRVIVEGLQKIRPGAPVQATEAGAAPAAANVRPQPKS
jgi:membrane fusion protein (multidrug efflux system)